VEKAQHWNSRGHFFAAAAEAMRRILVEYARRSSGSFLNRYFATGQAFFSMIPPDRSRRSFLKTSVALAGTAPLIDGLLQAQPGRAARPLLAYVGTVFADRRVHRVPPEVGNILLRQRYGFGNKINESTRGAMAVWKGQVTRRAITLQLTAEKICGF
jgi:hypothetical protein